MARVRSVEFLPEIFQTDANKQFLAATLDQLIQEPKFKKTQGFIGRTVGPGVNPNEKYVVESTKVRADYQLEPGIISLKPDTTDIDDAITYPGVLDSIAYQGGDSTRPDRLFASQYYTWDPFINWDTFINFSQYFWLPTGPEAVDVAATGVPATDNFVIDRANGVYTFSGLEGNNPTVDLMRGGSYTFQVAQNNKETVNYRVGNAGSSAYVINATNNPTLTLIRGNTYIFTLNFNGVYPFYIKTLPTTGLVNIYSTGVTNNGAVTGQVTFVVPQDAPDILYYAAATQSNMHGQFNIANATSGTGDEFWIQSAPGISGTLPSTPNISSRDVFGVTNNGEDLGTITFNVPTKTAQDFYYSLTNLGGVDLLTDLLFDQIDHMLVEDFLATYSGIDGISSMDGRTLIFATAPISTEGGGWYQTSTSGVITEVPLNDRRGIWLINYVTVSGLTYIQLTNTGAIAELEKFTILYGTVYASTSWFKNDGGVFRQIPLLTAAQDTLFYQDSTNPEIFGRIRLIEQSAGSTLYIEEILGKTNYISPNGVTMTNGLKVIFRGDIIPTSYIDNEYYVSGVGTAIELLPVTNFIVPETYANSTNLDDLDYLTIDRDSKDLNAWSRSNRWFHIDVINDTARYNKTDVTIDNAFRAKRPIIEFRGGIRLYEMGTEGKQPVNIIDFTETDAFSNIEGSSSYSVDGYTLVNGSRIIFAADEDANVRDKIWVVNFIAPTDDSVLVINLTLATDGDVLLDQSTLCLNGTTLTGITFWYDGLLWVEAQLKTKVQQAPLFNVYDADSVSFGNLAIYPSSTFAGSKLFSYAEGSTGILDPILQFPLQYLNLNNVGDIVFENNLYKDTFLYVRDNVSTTANISSGFGREYASRLVYTRLIGWIVGATLTQVRQQFKFTYAGAPLQLDVQAQSDGIVPAVKVYVGSKFRDPGTYTVATGATTTAITLDNTYVLGDVVEVLALSDQTSQQAFYQVPINLENNPLNGNSNGFTLGTIRTHYESICQNLLTLSGPINGANNTRDLGNIGPHGLIILQQSAPLTLAGYFNRSKEYNIFASLQYNAREYQKFKNLMLNEVTNLTLQYETPAEILVEALANITAGRLESSPFYWSDMLPAGSVYIQNAYTVTLITTNVFDTVQVYDYTSANYLGLLVYKGDVLLTRDIDYVVATDGPRITMLTPLAVGNVITVQEFSATYGSFVPNTPTKLGMYPAYLPEISEIKTTTGTSSVIIGHDGSQTPVFDDVRDQVLLEFETRIYNNLKLDENPVPISASDIIPGQFRTTGYTSAEVNAILNVDFLSYVGWNKLDYNTQNYSVSNEFTWNYSASQDKLTTTQTLLGAWRGINRYFYDTEDPADTPWEMLGFAIKPTWWESTYGGAPYTSDNLVLWDDLEAGIVADPLGSYVRPAYVRTGLSQVIPVDSQGNLLSPFNSVVGNYNDTTFQKSWTAGDGGPVEASWWNSSAYPFAVMRLMALTVPAKFYTLFADRDLYRYQEEFGQYLYNSRYRLDANGIQVYGDGTSKASYIDWIVDYNRVTGLNSTADLAADLSNIDVRLCYRLASFSDKQYIKLYTEKSSPNSINTTLQIPDESYDLLLYKNQPFDRVIYSSVIVQIVEGGYAVYGYSTTQPYFNILVSQGTGRLKPYTVGDLTIRVPTVYTKNVASIPYGYVFTNQTSVADFLLSYGQLLSDQGLTFTDRANGYQLDWSQMVVEFLYWSQQGWENNSLINLNPLAGALTITNPGAVADSIVTQTSENVLLDQNKRELPTRNLNIVRLDNTLTLEPLTDQSLSFADLRFTNFEHMIVLNNKSVFGDLIFEPITGARQSRLNFVGITSTEWNGTVDAQGFILNQDNVEEWTGLKKYTKGQIVKYKDQYWSAVVIVDPSLTFDFNKWVKSDYAMIELGLLPNIANKANQLQNSYSVNTANLESDNDLLSYGLIGFRPREYMAALNLDDVSQVNVYSQFLGSKGTILSAELLSQANLGKESADYSIYENWAVQRAVYGANANRSFVELRLNRALLSSNPSLVQVIQPLEDSKADQTILLSEVWRQSYKLTSTDFLPTTLTQITDTALPSAGYVSLDDADITTFDLAARSTIAANLEAVQVGATIWVAKVNNYDWNIYRCVGIPGYVDHICDNLDGTSILNFTNPHGLAVGDRVIIKQFANRVDGVYRVLTVAGVNRITIAYSFVAGGQTIINGVGTAFALQSQRVSQASDIVDLPYTNDIQTGAKVWVDNDGSGQWTVLQKENQFNDVVELAPELLDASEQYGQSVTQARNRFASLVGSPRYGFPAGEEKGAVYVYVKNYSDQYAPVSPVTGDAVLTLDIPGVRGYGNAVDFGNQTWAAAGASKSLGPASQADVGYATVIYRDPDLGAPGTNPYAQWQLLVPPELPNTVVAGEFGYSVAVSTDERWLYVSAPGANNVHAYGQVDWQDQFIRVSGNGTTTAYSIVDTIQISAATQLKVTLDGTVQELNVNYTVNGGLSTVTFTTPPTAGSVVDISRYNKKTIDGGSYYNVTQTSTTGAGTLAAFTIIRIRNAVGQPGIVTPAGDPIGSVGVTAPGSGYIVGDTITFADSKFGGQANLVLTVTAITTGGGVGTFTIAYTPVSLTSVFSLNEYFFTATNIYSFSVYVDGVLYRPILDYDFNADSSSVGLDLTFALPDGTTDINPATYPPAGSLIVVQAKTYYEYVNTVTVAGLAADARFGHGITTTTDGRQILIGCKDEDIDSNVDAGSVYVFDRNVQRFIYGSDPSSTTFTVLGTVTAPVSVIVNNVFLINQDDAIIDAPNSFTVSGNNITINSDLQVGDVIEIETNQFSQMQRAIQQTVNSSNVVVDNPMEFTNFGQSVDICNYNCSLYVGAPQDSTDGWKSGSVQRSVNQSRVYGLTASTIANATLTAGNTLRVNNIDIAVPASPNNTIDGLATAINSGVPNVTATSSTTGFLTIRVTNSTAATPGNKLQVAPGSVGTAFDDLGFETFVYTQSIYSPYPVDFAGFGSSISIDDSAYNLVVGAPRGTLYLITVFDDDTTFFDDKNTIFFSIVTQSGAVYTYDYLASTNESVSNPGMFAFGLQITDTNVYPYDTYGTAVSYVDGVLMIGAPGNDATADDSAGSNYGRVFVFENPDRLPAWTPIHTQQPVVDIRLLNSVFTYDRLTSARTEQFDFFDPLQGKILGAAKQNINYISAIDPAAYNVGQANNIGNIWTAEHVGEIWWDISTVRFIDPNQDDIVYASRRWGQVFPGSSIDMYQWVQSTVAPADYTGQGTPLTIFSYTLNSRLGINGIFNTYYYFWVRGITDVSTQQGKTLAAQTVANYIANPKASGIPYIAPVNASTIAIYNATTVIQAADTIINVEFDREYTDSNVHVEYELIAQDKADGFLSTNLYRKLLDSFCGVDTAGNIVPDANLNEAERYGVQFRPRQSMFVNRFSALKNYIVRTNTVFARYPFAENKSFELLNSSEPIPPSTSGSTVNWNLQVANLEILGFQDISAVPLGYKYLVDSDSSQNGLWTIYVVQLGQGVLSTVRELGLIRVQNYDTKRYWSYVNWYLPGYNSSTKVIAEVQNYSALATISVATGSSVKVTANAQGKFEIYLLTDLAWERVGLEDGTIEISEEIYNYALGRFGFDVEVFDAQYFDQEPVIETRKIIQAINQELFIGELLIERNKLLTLMFNFVLSEFSAPEWLVKTSLIDVDHRIRNLEPFQNYRQDNQEFVLDYIKEVKPYHVQIREFNLLYNGSDSYAGDFTDFDVPAYYNTSLVVPQYTSPILNIDDTTDARYQEPYLHGTAQQDNTLSDTSPGSLVWQAWPYNQWYSNYLLTLQSITVGTIVNATNIYINTWYTIVTAGTTDFVTDFGAANNNPGTAFTATQNGSYIDNFTMTSGTGTARTASGSGYTEAPAVTIVGDAETTATATAVLNSLGSVVSVVIIDEGSGYYTTPTIVFSGGNGAGAQAYAVMGNDLVRSFKTIIKYDRYQYQTTIVVWSSSGTYEDGTLVRYDDRVWRAASTDSTAVVGPTFDLENWVLVPADELSGVDRTMGYYVPGVNEPGLDLPLLIDGISYPGVQVWGDYFLGSNPNTTELPCTATTVTTNLITCTNTLGLQNNAPIRFSGTTFGGIVADINYYIKDVFSQTQFTISSEIGGFVINLTTATGTMQAITLPILDATYASNFSDVYLGTRYSDINIAGGEFIGPYEGHGPEELVNGAEFDTLDMRVYTRPGSDWSLFDNSSGSDGHGFQISSRRYIYDSANPLLSWDNLVENPVHIEVGNVTSGINLSLTVDYVVDWVARTIELLQNISDGDIINISAYELGGSSQLYRQNYVGDDVGNELIVPVSSTEIYDPVLFVNGVYTEVDNWEPYYPSEVWDQLTAYNKLDVVHTAEPTVYYRALQDVIAGIAITNTAYWQLFVPTTLSKILLLETYTSTHALNLTVLGATTPIQYSWSTFQSESFVVTTTINVNKTVTLSNAVTGTNIPNMIVQLNGIRLRPYEGIEWIGNGSTASFGLPQRGGYSQSIINAALDITVYVDDVLQPQGSVYGVTNWDGSNDPGRQVVFVTPPADGARILISVSTVAAYLVVGTQLQLVSQPGVGAILSVITFNDTSQQNILTQVYQGPVVTGGIVVVEAYDETVYDEGAVDNDPGSYDYSEGIVLSANEFDLGRTGIDSSRLWVTLNGYRLFDGQDFTVQGQYVILSSGTIGASDIVVIEEFTNSVVPEALVFRVFQDMRGIQATYRITPGTTTTVVANFTSTANIAYMDDVQNLTQPDLQNGVFGVCTIGGERIMYRYRNTTLNTISGLMRGTAGTAADDHYIGQEVYDMSRGNLLSEEYQDRIISDSATDQGTAVTGLVIGNTYTITVVGSTNFISVGALSNTVGITFVATGAGTGSGKAIISGQTDSIFYAPSIYLPIVDPQDSSTMYIDHSIEVYVGGTRQYPITEPNTPSQYRYTIFTVEPLVSGNPYTIGVEFIPEPDPESPVLLPPAGQEITVAQRRGVSWYAPGTVASVTTIIAGNSYFISNIGNTDFIAIGAESNTAGILFMATAAGTGTGTITTVSDGIALQESNTAAARFLRGL